MCWTSRTLLFDCMRTYRPPVEALLQDVKNYVVAQRQLISTVASKKGADAFYIIILSTIFLLILWFFLILFSFAIAFLIGDWLDSPFLGFLIVSLFYIFLGVMVWLIKDRFIKVPLLRLFLKLTSAKNKPSYE